VNRYEALVLAVVAPLATAGTLLWGCSDSNDPPKTTADAGPEISTVTNACTNDKDKIGVFRSYCAPDPFERDAAAAINEYKSFAELSSDCARFCVLDPVANKDPTCVNRCLKRATAGAISDLCLGCREEMVACGRKYCLAECAPGPLETKCLVCMCGNNYPDNHSCYDPYNKCSGLGFTYCQQLDAGTFDGFPAPTDAGLCD
jgi:hypothetical protein